MALTCFPLRSAHLMWCLQPDLHPKKLDYDCKHEIPLDIALDKSALAQCITQQDTVAVVGSAQSAILLLKYLTELHCGRIINFYLIQLNLGANRALKLQLHAGPRCLAQNTTGQFITLVQFLRCIKSLGAYLHQNNLCSRL